VSVAGRLGRHPFHYDQSWLFPVGPEELWSILSDTTAYPGWWPWLRRPRLPALVAGGVARFSVVPPLPYHIDVELHLDEVEPVRRIHTAVGGDLDGWASLDLSIAGPGQTQVRLRSTLAFSRPGLRALTLVGRPVLAWGHESVVRRGLQGFVAAQGFEVAPCPTDQRPSRRRTIGDGVMAGAVAGLASGAPSTAWTLRRHTSPLTASRAAGTLLGRASLARGALAHTIVSLGWGVVLSAVLPDDHRVVGGVVAGAAIAALDLGLIARRRFPAVADLPLGPQVADHLLYGALVGLVLDRRCSDTA
jgi:hypothetical protein